MNFSIKIYPFEYVPCNKTWRDIKEDYVKLSEGIYTTNVNFNLIDSNEDYARLIIGDLDRLKVIDPSQIIKTVETKLRDNMDQIDEFEKNTFVRYVYNRKLEFINLGKLISWNIDFGIKGLYEIGEESMEEVQERMLSDYLFLKFKKALNLNKHILTLETDLITNYLDPIWILTLVFCKLTKGVAFVEHSFSDFALRPGYYEINDLETICANGITPAGASVSLVNSNKKKNK